ncbi:MAG: hypothetical protein PF517_22745 [Salinivirgaceae bacterium]|jgi:hypothetical protein|nr:hypothetical protein [Salinivirgaceae bacterium]
MKNVLTILFLFVTTAIVTQGQNQSQTSDNKGIEFIDELDARMYQAAQHFINFNDQGAAEQIRKASFFITMQAYEVQPEHREKFIFLENKLNKLSEDLSQGKVTTIQQLTKIYAESYMVLANFYLNLSLSNYKENNSINCVIYLYQAANYLILGAKWVGYEVNEGTRGIRKSITNLSNSVSSRNEINQTELKKVLDFIQKEIKKFDQKITSK